MDLQLGGKRALVTGSSAGIGTGIAKVLSSKGAFVVVHGRDKKRTEKVMNDITQSGVKAAIALGDLGTDEGAQSVVSQARTALNGIDNDELTQIMSDDRIHSLSEVKPHDDSSISYNATQSL